MNPLHPVRSLRPQRILASLYDEPEKLAEMVKAFYSGKRGERKREGEKRGRRKNFSLFV